LKKTQNEEEYAMGAFNWADRFEQLKELTREDILKQVRKTEIVYWVYVVIFVILIIVGVSIIFQPSANNSKALFGLFIAVTGVIQIAWTKLSMQIKLSMLYTMWINSKR
jgi:uncharacterized membrane protein HdeD (DUF308 family)